MNKTANTLGELKQILQELTDEYKLTDETLIGVSYEDYNSKSNIWVSLLGVIPINCTKSGEITAEDKDCNLEEIKLLFA